MRHFTTAPAPLRQPLPLTTASDNMAAAVPHPDAGEATVDPQESPAAGTSSGTPAAAAVHDTPVCLIVLGMAGSGKTTFVQVRRTVQRQLAWTASDRLETRVWPEQMANASYSPRLKSSESRPHYCPQSDISGSNREFCPGDTSAKSGLKICSEAEIGNIPHRRAGFVQRHEV